jgi:hypothetical protein
MKTSITLLTTLLLAAFIAVPAQSHHSFTAVYQPDESITIEGTVVQFLFRNPHSVLHVLTTDEDGKETRWAIEWQGATALGAGGVSAQTIRAGDPVIVTGHPGRVAQEHRILMLTIERTTDGFGWGNGEGERVE